MYSYASKIQCLHGERSSSHLRPHLLSSHTHLSIPQRQPLLLIAWLSLQKVLWMNTEATTNVYAFIHIFSLFYTKGGTLHSSFHTFGKVFHTFGLCYLCGQVSLLGGEGRRTGNWIALCSGGHVAPRPEMESSSVDFPSWILPIAWPCLLDQLFAHASEYYWSTGRLLGSSLSS